MGGFGEGPLRERFVHAGCAYQVMRWGSDGAPPLVLLHGFAQSSNTWEAVAPRLSQTHQVLAVDFAGHGKSDRPADAALYERDAVFAMLEALITERFFCKVALAGYSMGGRVALAFACRHASLLSALVLESAGLGPNTEQQRAAMQRRDAELIEFLRGADGEEFADYWESLPLFASERHLPGEARAQIRAARAANDPKALALAIRGLGQHGMADYSKRIGHLPMPVLYLAGILDRKYLKVAENLQYEANVSCVLLNTGHNTHLEDPDTFCRQVGAFLAEQTRRSGRPQD